ncbi:hypothetical protein BKA65DRAFT_157112 [Rhexocercosporidium sp. MPI-PUGE-AT-0058]|nr:hypothetical protein BKA65DRAFT_157112 [Rhexocercosporidium sp. MPI-PUGE-AT-0058]
MAGRQTNQTEVPPPEDPDRKRVLNVLAQRRYRQRQRARLQELEQKTAKLSGEKQGTLPKPEGNRGMGNEKLLETQSHHSTIFSKGAGDPPLYLLAPTIHDVYNDENIDIGTGVVASSSWASDSGTLMAPSHSLVSSNWMSANFPIINPYHGSASPDADLQTLELDQIQFPDDRLLNVSGLKTTHATYEIAILLQCEESIRNLDYRRTFNETTSRNGVPLPPSFLPTEEQKLIPHHPILDIIPWASSRSKLISVFNRASTYRPPMARDPGALMRLFQDMQDPKEGLRLNGPDMFNADNWEVGQQFLLNWWWTLECFVIEKSSASRVMRGQEHLSFPE